MIPKTALISVSNKDRIEEFVILLQRHNIVCYTSSGTHKYLLDKEITTHSLENLTKFSPILDGRVKTLHPSIFGGILAIRDNNHHISELKEFEFPLIDLVVVDLYPFETILSNENCTHETLIEYIDIGGVSLIRAAAKNYKDVIVVTSEKDLETVKSILSNDTPEFTHDIRKELATSAFYHTMNYDNQIYTYLNGKNLNQLRYGENPHQKAEYFGSLDTVFHQLSGKNLSYNNLLDIHSGLMIIYEFSEPTIAILKHTVTCGLASSINISSAWDKSLECDPLSAFGGVIISNTKIDEQTAIKLNKHFYEVVIAPDYSKESLSVLMSNTNRIVLKLNSFKLPQYLEQTLLNGKIKQSIDSEICVPENYNIVTNKKPAIDKTEDLHFAEKAVKHLKSNAIAIVKNKQLIGAGTGQTSRIDSFQIALNKAKHHGFNLNDAVLASDGFFPFHDVVDLAYQNGIKTILQPGGSKRDIDSINFCNEHDMSMIFTGIRHFKH